MKTRHLMAAVLGSVVVAGVAGCSTPEPALGGTTAGGFAVADRSGAIVSMAIIGVVMAVLYFGALWLLRSPELRGFAAPLLARFHKG